MSAGKSFDPYLFSIHTTRVTIDGDQYFKTSIFELPDVDVYEKTAAEAYDVMIQCITDLHEAAIHDGRPFPIPEVKDADDYSGRVTLRMRKELHRRLDQQAKRNRTTLNAEIVCQLSDTSSIQEIAYRLVAETRSATLMPKVIGPATYTGMVISTGVDLASAYSCSAGNRPIVNLGHVTNTNQTPANTIVHILNPSKQAPELLQEYGTNLQYGTEANALPSNSHNEAIYVH